ncbi:hypothetical protein Mapa_014054 [Marchantia paleacea]|nr:hypothetical protein Mapa_014054 [Marchantia paleacea]
MSHGVPTRRKLLWASYLCSIVLVLQYLAQRGSADPILATSLGFCNVSGSRITKLSAVFRFWAI